MSEPADDNAKRRGDVEFEEAEQLDFVLLLAFERIDVEVDRERGIGGRIPGAIIDPVQNPVQHTPTETQQSVHTGTVVRPLNLLCVCGRDSDDTVCEGDAAL